MNHGTFNAAPVAKKKQADDDWKLRQVEIDGKMLESQAQKYGFGETGDEGCREEQGMDWDEFRRDAWDPAGGRAREPGLEEQMRRMDVGGESRGSAREREASRETREQRDEPVRAVREPKGPEAGAGRGFKGRGNGRRIG